LFTGSLAWVTATVFIALGLYHISTMASISKTPITIADQAKAAAALQNFSVSLFQVSLHKTNAF
jgi:hypothetical protein